MKIKYVLSGLLLVSILHASIAFAGLATGPGVQVGTGEGALGSVTPVDITVDYEAGGDVVGGQFQITYDSANLTPDLTSGCTSANWACSIQSPGVLQYVSNIVVAGLPTELIGTIAFDISSAAGGTYPLAVANEAYGDINETPIPPAGTANGQIAVATPDYGSDPAPGPLPVGSGQTGGVNPSTTLTIGNIGGVGTGLDVSCVESPDTTAYIVANGVVNGLAKNATHDVTVSCNAALAPNTYNGTLVCTHNGDGTTTASPAEYALSCTITEGPRPAYSSSPSAGTPIGMSATFEGDAITPVNVSISNSGDPLTTLTGTCGLTGNSEISVVDGAFSVLQGGAADIQTVSCDSSVEGNYSATLSCPHNGSNASPATYAVTCDVGGKRPAIFDSSPAPGSTTDMTDGLDVLVGDAAPESILTFYNVAEPLSSDLSLACFKSGGDAAITVTPDISGGILIAPQGNSGVTFSCNTDAPDSYSATYFCDYRTDGAEIPTDDGVVGTAEYTFTCDVREGESDVSEDPVSGTTLTTVVSTGETGAFQVTFSEDADENVDGQLITCGLDDGSAFSITSPASFPADIPAGGSLVVTVEGTDPGDAAILEDVLRCTYSDSGTEGTEVFYNLVLQIGSVATFTVTKDFTDDNPNEVGVRISCDNGLPIKSDSTVGDGSHVTFVVGSFESGELNCEIFESPVPGGYTPSFIASGDSASSITDISCVFTAVGRGDDNDCAITNSPDPVDVVIEKEWFFEGSASDSIDTSYVLTLYCNAEIVDGYPPYLNGAASISNGGLWYKSFKGFGSDIFTAEVIPEYPSSKCWVDENIFDDAVEIENNCGNLEVSAGNGDSCTVTNTVYFEGIPTLNQYGLAILALLMLGVGMVGFRRFA